MIIYYSDKYTGGREESHKLLKKAFKAYTGDEERAKTLIGALQRGEHGKPYIEGFSCFSISHTGSIWAVLIADRECGLDIQLARDCDILAISKRFFAPGDAAETAEDGLAAFFRIWVRREALTKALGSTVYDPELPNVSGDEIECAGRKLLLRDIWLPEDIRLPEMPSLYAAVCIEVCPSDTDIDISFQAI